MAIMPTNIILADGATTPVNVTYTPEYQDANGLTFADRRLASPELWPRFTLSFSRATQARKSYHVSLSVSYPIVRNVDGVDTVAGIARYEKPGRFVIPTNATEQERKHLSAIVRNALSHTTVRAYVELLDPII